MSNCKKITNLLPISNQAERGFKTISLDNVAETGTQVETFALQDGDKFQFPKIEDVTIAEVAVRPGSTGKMYLVAGMLTRNGVTKESWFCLNTLRKTDVNREPVHPKWYNMASNKERVEALCNLGTIEAKGTVKIMVPVFGNDGRPQSTIDENNVSRYVAREQTVALLSEPAE